MDIEEFIDALKEKFDELSEDKIIQVIKKALEDESNDEYDEPYSWGLNIAYNSTHDAQANDLYKLIWRSCKDGESPL